MASTMTRFTILVMVAFFMGCAARNPQTVRETGVSRDLTVSLHRDRIVDCVANEMDAYPIYAIGGNEHAVTIRKYEDRTELFLFPSLVILRDNKDEGAEIRIIVKQPYWKTGDLLDKFESFIRRCGSN